MGRLKDILKEADAKDIIQTLQLANNLLGNFSSGSSVPSPAQAKAADSDSLTSQFREGLFSNTKADQGNYNHCLSIFTSVCPDKAKIFSSWTGTLSRRQRKSLQETISNMFFDHLITSENQDVTDAALETTLVFEALATCQSDKKRTQKAINDGLIKPRFIPEETEEAKKARKEFEEEALKAIDDFTGTLTGWKNKLEAKLKEKEG